MLVMLEQQLVQQDYPPPRPCTRPSAIKQPMGTAFPLWGALRLAKTSRLKTEPRGGAASPAFSQTASVTMCWNVVMEFLPKDAPASQLKLLGQGKGPDHGHGQLLTATQIVGLVLLRAVSSLMTDVPFWTCMTSFYYFYCLAHSIHRMRSLRFGCTHQKCLLLYSHSWSVKNPSLYLLWLHAHPLSRESFNNESSI